MALDLIEPRPSFRRPALTSPLAELFVNGGPVEVTGLVDRRVSDPVAHAVGRLSARKKNAANELTAQFRGCGTFAGRAILDSGTVRYWGEPACFRGELNIVFRDEQGTTIGEVSSALLGHHTSPTSAGLCAVGMLTAALPETAPTSTGLVLLDIEVSGLRAYRYSISRLELTGGGRPGTFASGVADPASEQEIA